MNWPYIYAAVAVLAVIAALEIYRDRKRAVIKGKVVMPKAVQVVVKMELP
jgi:hypothetical protein